MFVTIRGRIRGEAQKEVDLFVNSFSDYVILPPEIVEEVKPKLMRIRERIDTPGGTREGPLFLAELEVEDPQSGNRRSAEVEVLMLEGEPPVMGIRALEGLGIEVNFKERTYRLV